MVMAPLGAGANEEGRREQHERYGRYGRRMMVLGGDDDGERRRIAGVTMVNGRGGSGEANKGTQSVSTSSQPRARYHAATLIRNSPSAATSSAATSS